MAVPAPIRAAARCSAHLAQFIHAALCIDLRLTNAKAIGLIRCGSFRHSIEPVRHALCRLKRKFRQTNRTAYTVRTDRRALPVRHRLPLCPKGHSNVQKSRLPNPAIDWIKENYGGFCYSTLSYADDCSKKCPDVRWEIYNTCDNSWASVNWTVTNLIRTAENDGYECDATAYFESNGQRIEREESEPCFHVVTLDKDPMCICIIALLKTRLVG